MYCSILLKYLECFLQILFLLLTKSDQVLFRLPPLYIIMSVWSGHCFLPSLKDDILAYLQLPFIYNRVLFYSFEISDFNPKQTGNRVAIAAYDSCRNGGIISNFHSPIFAQVQTSSNYLCDKGIVINWTPYVGWLVDTYDVWIVNSDKQEIVYNTRVAGNTTSLTYTLPFLGVNLDIYIRANKLGSVVSSTSNRVQLFVSDFPKPNKNTKSQLRPVGTTY